MEGSGRGFKPGEPGFTLTELLIVVVITGVLAAVAVPAFLSVRQSAYNADAQSTTRSAATAAMSYLAANRTFNGLNDAALDAIQPTLPDTENAAPYSSSGLYTVRVVGGGSDFRIDVRHAQGSHTYRATDSSTVELP